MIKRRKMIACDVYSTSLISPAMKFNGRERFFTNVVQRLHNAVCDSSLLLETPMSVCDFAISLRLPLLVLHSAVRAKRYSLSTRGGDAECKRSEIARPSPTILVFAPRVRACSETL